MMQGTWALLHNSAMTGSFPAEMSGLPRAVASATLASIIRRAAVFHPDTFRWYRHGCRSLLRRRGRRKSPFSSWNLGSGWIQRTRSWRSISTSRSSNTAITMMRQGDRPTTPKVLLKVVLYGYYRGIISSRRIAEACRRNVVFMALSADSRPHFTTIASFVSKRSMKLRACSAMCCSTPRSLDSSARSTSRSVAASCRRMPKRSGVAPTRS
jgi:hypothetical protein